jgi:integrase
MATLRERSPGVWEIRVFTGRDRTGRPRQVSRTIRGSRRVAEKAAAALMADTPGPEGKRSVAELLTLWQELHRDRWAASTVRNQASRARLVASGPLGSRRVASVKVEDVDRWVLRMRAQGVGAASIHNQLMVLRAAMAQAVKWDWISRNPAALAAPAQRPHAERPGMLDDAVIAAIKAAPHEAAALAFRLSAATGARRAELAALRWEDLRGAELVIGGQIVAHPNADPHHRPVLVREPTKTRQVRRVTLDPGTLRAIAEWGKVHRGLGPWMLSVGDRPPSPDAISWWWRHSREASGIGRRWRLHDLRHWSATTAIGTGADVRTVAHRLGHSNPGMTLRVYAHAFAAADASAAAALGRALDAELD